MTIFEAIIMVLETHKKPMHYNEITREIQEKGYFESSGSSFHYSVLSKMSSNVKKKDSPLVWVKAGTYCLKKYYEGPKSINEIPSLFPEIELPNSTTGEEVSDEAEIIIAGEDEEDEIENYSQNTTYVGKAGELAVCSELLIRGFNANILYVDDGIDIVATKNGKTYNFQVKTSTRPVTTKDAMSFYHSLKQTSFRRYYDPSVFYVFAERTEVNSFTYIIMNCYHLDMLIRNGNYINLDQNGTYGITVRFHTDGRFTLGAGKYPIDQFVNDWSMIDANVGYPIR